MNAAALTLYLHAGEPRVLDTDLAARLGMARPTNIRAEIIARNRAELESFGLLHCHTANSGKPGRPAKAFYLNEEQALLVVMFSRTPKAAEARREIIAVFQAYRRGELVQAPPTEAPADVYGKPWKASWRPRVPGHGHAGNRSDPLAFMAQQHRVRD